MTRLNPDHLQRLPKQVAVPEYDRGQVSAGIAHFGVGGFHRAHEALVLDRLLHDPRHSEWGIVGIGVRPADQAMRDALLPQGGLYSLTEKDSSGTNTRIIGSLVDFLYAPDDPSAVLALLSSPAIKIVSLTITEGGYNFHQVTGEFDWSNAEVAADVERHDRPQSVFGFIVHALAARHLAGIAPFTVMSCDNIQANGELARRMCVSFAWRVNTELADWMEQEVAFPSSMVDRITPVTTEADTTQVEKILGVSDQWPVVCEPFFQWVLEDRFPAGRPAFEEGGVQIVADVEPYELMKLRLLNASHQALAYFGYLLGYRYVHDAVGDPLIEGLLRRYMVEEAMPTLPAVPGIDLLDYCDTLISRFLNAEVADTVARLCADASDRIPKWLVPVISERLEADEPPTLAIAIVASWARYAEGVDEHGEPITIVDNLSESLVELAQSARDGDTLAFVRNPQLFGDLSSDPRFAELYEEVLQSLWARGARYTLESLLQ